MICHRCGKQRLDHTTPPMPLCECEDGPRARVRMDLSRGGYMDACVSPDASQETLDALRAIGEAALSRMLADEEAESS